MYDTVKLELHQSDVPGINFIKDVAPLLSRVDEGVYNEKPFLKGYLGGNLKVVCTESRLKIPNGNFRSYYYDDPFEDFSRASFEEAINKLEFDLSLPLSRARIKRLDFGPTVSLEYPSEVYFDYLGNIPKYKRLDMDNGVVWKGSKDSIVIYCKQSQLRETGKGHKIPKEKQGDNHIRIELRVSKQLGKYFGKNDIRLAELYKEDFYQNVCNKLELAYNKIQKGSDQLESIKITQKKSELIRNLASVGLSIMHPSLLTDEVNKALKMGLITYKQAYDQRKVVCQLINLNFKENPSGVISELNDRVKLKLNRI